MTVFESLIVMLTFGAVIVAILSKESISSLLKISYVATTCSWERFNSTTGCSSVVINPYDEID